MFYCELVHHNQALDLTWIEVWHWKFVIIFCKIVLSEYFWCDYLLLLIYIILIDMFFTLFNLIWFMETTHRRPLVPIWCFAARSWQQMVLIGKLVTLKKFSSRTVVLFLFSCEVERWPSEPEFHLEESNLIQLSIQSFNLLSLDSHDANLFGLTS